MKAKALWVLCLPLSCEPSAAPRAAPSLGALALPARGALHQDPSPPFTLSVESVPRAAGEAEVIVRARLSTEVGRLTLGLSLPQELAALSSPLRKDFGATTAGATLTLRVRVRRNTPGSEGVTLRAWAEAHDQGVLLGDERALTLFGAPAPEGQPHERVIRAADGTLLYDTVVY